MTGVGVAESRGETDGKIIGISKTESDKPDLLSDFYEISIIKSVKSTKLSQQLLKTLIGKFIHSNLQSFGSAVALYRMFRTL